MTRLLWLAAASASGLLAQCELPSDAPAAAEARPVFANLVRAAEVRQRLKLAVVEADCATKTSRFEGAWYEPQKAQISLDARLVALCAKSADCLAFLLGHELGHVLQDLSRQSGFAGPGQDRAALEADADLRGGVLGYRAGYDSLRSAPELLERVYKAYGLGPEITGYPALPQRQEAAKTAREQLEKLIPVLEAANFFALTGEAELSAECFDHVSRAFPSREIFNGKGVALALELSALKKWTFPWVLDAESRLDVLQSTRGATAPDEEELFEQAQAAFEQARKLDRQYAPAWVNQAALLALKDPAGRHAALALDDAAEHVKGLPTLEAALRTAREAAAGRAPAQAATGQELEAAEDIEIGGVTAKSLLRRKSSGEATAITGASGLLIGAPRYYTDYQTLVLERPGGRWAIVSTRSGSQIGIGAAELQKQYCESGSDCARHMGSFLHFPKHNAVFALNAAGRVTRWFTYARQ